MWSFPESERSVMSYGKKVLTLFAVSSRHLHVSHCCRAFGNTSLVWFHRWFCACACVTSPERSAFVNAPYMSGWKPLKRASNPVCFCCVSNWGLLQILAMLRRGYWYFFFSKCLEFKCNIIFKTASHSNSMAETNSFTAGEGDIFLLVWLFTFAEYQRLFLLGNVVCSWAVGLIEKRLDLLFFCASLCHQLDVTSSWWLYTKGPGSPSVTQHKQSPLTHTVLESGVTLGPC